VVVITHIESQQMPALLYKAVISIFSARAVVGIACPWPHFWGADRSPLGLAVSVVDLGEVGRARKLGLRRRSRGGAAGASLRIPRWSRILRIASGFVIAARIFMRPGTSQDAALEAVSGLECLRSWLHDRR